MPSNVETLPSQSSNTEEIKKRFIVLPYVSSKVEGFAQRLKKLVEDNFEKVELNVALKAPNEVGQLFPFKDKIQKVENRSFVVYKINCTKCEASYIGKTERILSYRIKEHQSQQTSACLQHTKTHPGHLMDYKNVEVIDTADNELKVSVKELLHILKCKPILNKQLNAQSKFDIKTLIIAAHPQFSLNGVVAS